MKLIDIIIILALAVVLFFVIRRMWRTRKTGGCGCGCEGCTHRCAAGQKHRTLR